MSSPLAPLSGKEKYDAYHIKYSVKDKEFENFVDAKDLKSAKTKLGRKHGYKTGNMITIKNVKVIGYY